jgi:4-alpha-glucanotransferase
VTGGGDEPLWALARAAGLLPRYKDVTGTERHMTSETARALLAAMGLPASTDADAAESLAVLADPGAGFNAWRVVDSDATAPLDVDGNWHLMTEDGEAHHGPGPLPSLQMGYHRLETADAKTLLIAAPRRLPRPAPGWGVTLPLYGLRTADAGGFGDYADLADAVAGLGRAGAGFVGINPVHAGFPTDRDTFSPYSPSSRQRLNIAHVAVLGWTGTPGDLIDYATDRPAQLAALRAAFAALPDATRSAAQTTARADPDLWRFATHQALADRHGPLWPDWPADLQDADSPAVATFAEAEPDAVTFHAWAQGLAVDQLAHVRKVAEKTGMRFGLYLDLAVGTHPGGAETWADRESFARGVSLGAPPDAFSPGGQSWGIAPFNPRALVVSGFRAFIDTLRAQFRHARLLRIDHVLGFDRAFWVPECGAPGGYVTMPRAALLAITRVEAARAGATVVGEDLGNVPDGLRDAMADAGVLGCRVAMFERDGDTPVYRAAADWDALTLASFSSHDLPTWAGWRAGRDLDWWARIGQLPETALPAARAARTAEVAAFDAAHGTAGGDPEMLHLMLAKSPAALVALQTEDMLGVIEQPNLPGTIDAHPNWRRRLPVAARDLGDHPAIRRTAELVRRKRT